MTENDPSDTRDVLVVGGGPAGATAAALCAGKGLSVGLIDCRERPRESPDRVWLNAEARKLFEPCGADPDALFGQPLQAVTFHTSDFAKSMRSSLAPSAVHVIDRAVLENALLEAAASAGTSIWAGQSVTALEVLEEHVRLDLADDSQLEARYLIGADGAASGIARQLGLVTPTDPGWWRAQWDADLTQKSKPKPAQAELDMAIVLGLIEARGFGYVLHQPDHYLIGVAGPGTADEIGEHFELFVSDAEEADLVPRGVQPTQPVVVPSPAGAAVEMETHVGKRSLLVGSAGGFVSAISDEGIYPGMWSAAIAVDVLVDALGSETGQDVLAEYDTRWRVAMADYLRMPNTDLHFLLPLIFSNQQMADRMAAAFFCGQNI